MNTKRFISFSTILFTTVSSVFSQCIIAGTDFDTDTELCCPILKSNSNEGGWYNEELNKDSLCKTEKFANLESVKQSGIGGVFNSNSNNNITDIDKVFHLNTLPADGKPSQYGYTTITAQPKLIHSFCKANEESNNMLVNIGSASLCPVISYTVYGLAPGTTAKLSFNLYNLLDSTYFDFLVNDAKVKFLNEYITEYKYSAGSINGNALGFGVVSSNDNIEFNTLYNNAFVPTSLKNATIAKPDFGKSQTVTHIATVPENGNITFYFYRTNDCFQIPIGIDDIKVTGEVRPLISAKGNPCPEQPILLTSKQKYPEGTKFSWEEAITGQKSSNANFNFIPDAAETDYTVTFEVTLPGCNPAKSDSLKIHSGTCCTSNDGAPLAMTNLFFDDFGNFISDDLYEWTDKYGVTHTEQIPAGHMHYSQSLGGPYKTPCVRAYNIESSGATLNMPYIKDEGANKELYDHGMYVISAHGGYPGGVDRDADGYAKDLPAGQSTGGMLQFDLLDDDTQDEFFEIDIDHICTGKEITFGAAVASMSEHPGCIEVSLEHNGKVLEKESESFNGGSDGWKNIYKSFILEPEDVDGVSEATITMKLKHNQDCVPLVAGTGDTRDYAIDNIFFAVCTPPNIELNYSAKTGKDILDLNTNDVLTLNAVTTDAITKFYTYTNGQLDPSKKIGYVYQYTFQDPSTETEINKINWHTIHKEEVVESKSFDVDFEKYWDEISSNMTDNADLIYFRVVAGEYSDLIADQSWKKASALSPCRKVSISLIPVAVKVNYVPSTTMTYLYYDDFGKFVSDSTYEWTDNNREIHTEQIPAGHSHIAQSVNISDKTPCVRAYNIEATGAATLQIPYLKDKGIDNEFYNIGAYAVSAHGAYPGGVKYDNSGTQNGGMLQFDLLDDGSQDEFFKVDFDHICTDQEIAFGVDFASISLHPGAIEVKLECNGKTLVSKTASVSEGSDGWKSVNGKFTLNAEDVDGAAEATITMKISNTLTTTTGEGRDYAIDNIYFAVAGLDCGATTCKDIKNSVDNTNKIEYYKKDAKKDSLKSLDQQNDAVFKAALATTGYTLKIGIVEDATEATAPNLKSAKLGTASSTIPVPTIKDINSTDDEYLWYYTYLESAEGCVSDTVLVGVIINGEKTSLKDTPAKAVSIAPNPASTKISVIAEEAVEKVEILNMVGEVVKVSNRKDIDTSNLSNGVYFVRTTINDETTVHKLVINK
ncbi:MAG: T9SS type A sorting domain-containing protein [Paludibacteraceae bacterium]|nr:T9SS type A sorting domain-containing protein [Paludibacteraceae bacterium]